MNAGRVKSWSRAKSSRWIGRLRSRCRSPARRRSSAAVWSAASRKRFAPSRFIRISLWPTRRHHRCQLRQRPRDPLRHRAPLLLHRVLRRIRQQTRKRARQRGPLHCHVRRRLHRATHLCRSIRMRRPHGRPLRRPLRLRPGQPR